MSVVYSFDKDEYFYTKSQYFAIEAAKLYNGKVCLWIDSTKHSSNFNMIKILCHAYAKITDDLYVDAYGTFTNIEQRASMFKYGQKEVIECTVDEAKGILKEMNVPFTKTEDKRNAREYLRNNVLVFDILFNNEKYTVGLYNHIDAEVHIISYNSTKNIFGKFISRVNANQFVKGITKAYGFKENKGWYHNT